MIDFGKIVLVDGRVDAENAEPKILVDNISTTFDMVSAANKSPEASVLAPPVPLVMQPDVGLVIDLFGEPPPPELFPPEWDIFGEFVAGEITPASAIVTTEGGAEQSIPDTEGISGAINRTQQPVLDEPVAEKVDESSPATAIADSSALRDAYNGLATSMPRYLVPPASVKAEDGAIHMITVVFRTSGDKTRDVLRLRRIHGIITSYPGDDRFAFHVFERNRGYLLEFPNFTVGMCTELISRLSALIGADNIRIEKITFQ